jgi:hypothetical protein
MNLSSEQTVAMIIGTSFAAGLNVYATVGGVTSACSISDTAILVIESTAIGVLAGRKKLTQTCG